MATVTIPNKENKEKMKTIYLTIASILLTATLANAQEKVESDSNKIKKDDVEVVISPKKGQDSTIVRVAGMKIIVLNDERTGTDNIIIDNEVNGDSTDKKNCEDESVSHWAGFRLGVNGYLVNDGLPIPSSHDFLELDYAKSISVDLNLLEHDFRLYKQYVELVTGLGLHFANYSYKSDYATLSNTDPLSAKIDSTRILNKNKLRATYVTAPLMLGFSTNKDEDKAFRFAAGGQISWRIGSKLKQEYSLAGETFKPKVKSDFDLNPFLFHAVASVGYGPINIYANYGLNTLFEGNKTLALTPFDVGLQFMF
ncbi:MAG: outer membrane beta-barrel protein [Flavobacteriales bacterium]